jgi:hypothetical protein
VRGGYKKISRVINCLKSKDKKWFGLISFGLNNLIQIDLERGAHLNDRLNYFFAHLSNEK